VFSVPANFYIEPDSFQHQHLLQGGKTPGLVAITAVARELCGFIWAILMAVPETEN
jgi:hypothetical protein